jgi:hypothetical protein
MMYIVMETAKLKKYILFIYIYSVIYFLAFRSLRTKYEDEQQNYIVPSTPVLSVYSMVLKSLTSQVTLEPTYKNI